jgi:hypothetical protein
MKRCSRKHADTLRRLCERFAAPVIATITCQDIRAGHMQKIVDSAPTTKEAGAAQVPVRHGHGRPQGRVPG